MDIQNFTIHDWICLISIVTTVIAICTLAIQLKRLGRPDERSTAIRSYILAITFISLIISIPAGASIVPEAQYFYRLLLPITLSIFIGIISGHLYDKYRIL